MTIDELIALVDRRNELERELQAVRTELARQNVRQGFYRGASGRLLRVTEQVDQPRMFGTVDVRDELTYS